MTARITRKQFYLAGAFSNPRLYRKGRARSWACFIRLD
jgi:hypothetical protein